MADDGKIRVPSSTQPYPNRSRRVDPLKLDAGAVLAGRYAIEEVLGRGGMGVVLRAYDRVLREAVAIKILRPEYAVERRWVDRLAREVKLARQIRHPNVCRVFDFEQADGHTFIVMELAPGGSLRAELDSRPPSGGSLAERLADAQAIAAGLAAIHDAGVVHRDVTPHNVLRMGDGRLVVSDFGLAVDASETTTSIQGGTVAYMSPEVVRGARATFASDVWSLGVVLYEVVFGQKPTWRSPTSFDLVAPDIGRDRTLEEDVVLEACRACTSAVPARRPRRASDVAALLVGPRRWWPRMPRALRYVVLGLALVAVSGSFISGRRARRADGNPAAEEGAIALTGEAADWTDVSKVLFAVKDRIECLVVLLDRRTARLVWGTPGHAEDVDITTGRHFPSPLVPAAYKEGCPDLSPDGRNLLYQGYADNGRSFAFVSSHPDGSDARPMVAVDDPSMLSEPKWLPDGESFVFNSDLQHVGIYSLATNRTTILPGAPAAWFFHVAGKSIYLLRSGDVALVRRLNWPRLGEGDDFHLRSMVLDVASADGNVLYISAIDDLPHPSIIIVEQNQRKARRVGFLRDRRSRFFSLVSGGAVVVGRRSDSDLWVMDEEGKLKQLTQLGDVAIASHCGEGYLIGRYGNTGGCRIDRLLADGTNVESLASGEAEAQAACAPDGATWYISRAAPTEGMPRGRRIHRCTREGCTSLVDDQALAMDVSPDGSRLAYLMLGPSGPRVRWVSTEGGDYHDVSDSESLCGPGWSSSTTIWVSRRRQGQFLWTEMNVDTASPTGRVQAGTSGCFDRLGDPSSPVHPDLRVIETWESELRFLPEDKIPR